MKTPQEPTPAFSRFCAECERRKNQRRPLELLKAVWRWPENNVPSHVIPKLATVGIFSAIVMVISMIGRHERSVTVKDGPAKVVVIRNDDVASEPVYTERCGSRGPPQMVPSNMRDLFVFTPNEWSPLMCLPWGGTPTPCHQLGYKIQTERCTSEPCYVYENQRGQWKTVPLRSNNE